MLRTRALVGLVVVWVVTILAAKPSAGLVIGDGWSVDQPGAIAYGAVTGTGTSGDPFKFTITLSAAANDIVTLHFTRIGGAAGDETFFNPQLDGTNTGAVPWEGILLTVDDVTTDTIPVEPDNTGHPERAHIHRSVWNAANASHFQCVDIYCGSNGRYDMMLGLKGTATPLAQNQSATGSILRLHDIDEAGTDPMKFNVTFMPVPEPETLLLLALGIGALAVRRPSAAYRRAYSKKWNDRPSARHSSS
jgi:PEP-CTERM motif